MKLLINNKLLYHSILHLFLDFDFNSSFNHRVIHRDIMTHKLLSEKIILSDIPHPKCVSSSTC